MHRGLPLPLAALLVLGVGCPDPDGGGPNGRNPRVTVTAPANVVGNTMDVTVQVAGCDTVASATLYDGPRVIRTFSFSSNPVTLTLTTPDIPFSQDGMAAQLLLTAQVRCSDDRLGTSPAVGTVFLPVAETFELPNDEYFVTRFFFIDDAGPDATFVGCQYVTASQRYLVRVDQTGAIINTIDRTDVLCTESAVFTEPMGGVRWMLVPGVGALAFDSTLHVTSVARNAWSEGTQLVGGERIVGAPDGSAIITWNTPAGINNSRATVYRVRPNCLPASCPAYGVGNPGEPLVWATQVGGPNGGLSDEPYRVLGDPMVVGAVVVLPGFFDDLARTPPTVLHQVRLLNFNDGADSSAYIFDLTGSEVQHGPGESKPAHEMTLSPLESVVYLPWLISDDPVASEVRAYNAAADGSPIWVSPTFPVEIMRVVPFAGGTRLAALGRREAYFLDAADGTVLNPGHPARARSGYEILYTEVGPGTDIFLMTGAPPVALSTVPPLAGELITFADAALPEVVRYPVGTGNLFARVDSGGNVWLRTNAKLHRMLTHGQYITLKNQ